MADKELTDALKAAEDRQAAILKKLEDAGKPVYSQSPGEAVSYWDTIDDGEGSAPARENFGGHISLLKSAKKHVPVVPVDYRPHSVWKGHGSHHSGAFGEFLRDGYRNGGARSAEFMKRYNDALGTLKTIQGMSETLGGDGGFAVLPEFSTTIFEKVYGNQLFGMTDQYSVTGNNMTFPRSAETSRATGSRAGGIQAYWTAEGASITSSKPTLGQLSMKLKKLAVVVYLTDELIDDTGLALQQYVNRVVSRELEFMVGNALVNGTGAGQPQGLLNSGALLSISAESGQLTKTVVKENLDKMYARMFAGSIPNSVWFYNQDVIPSLLGLNMAVGTGGLPVYLPPGGYSAAPYGTLMGRPMMPLEFCKTVGTTGDLILADMKQYITISKGGIAQAQSMHVEFLTDQLALRFTLRVDGSTWENSPVTPFNGTNTQSSFVVLGTR